MGQTDETGQLVIYFVTVFLLVAVTTTYNTKSIILSFKTYQTDKFFLLYLGVRSFDIGINTIVKNGNGEGSIFTEKEEPFLSCCTRRAST